MPGGGGGDRTGAAGGTATFSELRNVAMALFCMGDVAKARGDFVAARERFDQARKLDEGLLQTTTRADLRIDLATTYERLADATSSAGGNVEDALAGSSGLAPFGKRSAPRVRRIE